MTVYVFSGISPDEIDYQNPLAVVKGESRVEIPAPDSHFRFYYSITSENGPGAIAAERIVTLEGALNFRDLGGYESMDGRTVKWGKIFRSDGLARLTPKDQDILKAMGLKLVIDLRRESEVKTSPDKLPGDNSVEYLHLPVSGADFDTVTAMERLKKGDTGWLTESFMRDGYINNIDYFSKAWGTVMKRLSDFENLPLVFHCTAGKDRTGACAALILLILGVPEETVILDHGLSNFYLADYLETIYAYLSGFGIERGKIFPYLTAPYDAIVALLDHIRNQYGSAENYLVTRADVSPDILEKLRMNFLE
jgi:protein-tyrosine phosphatase